MKVLYILGRGRSGSTILANVLGEIDGFFSAGELRTLWDPVVANRSDCGCGRPVTECPVWSQVLARLKDVDVLQAARWQNEIVKESSLLKLLRCRDGCDWPAVQSFASLTRRLYEAIADVTGCKVIVDSSKRPSYAAFLRTIPELDLHCVHLARDPRASAYSWQSRRYVSAHGDEVRRRNAFDSTVRWNLLNMGSETLLKRLPKDRYLRLRYEDFASEPERAVGDIRALVRETEQPSPFVEAATVELGINHTIGGNPSRFRTGRLKLEDKGEWRTEQDARSRWIASAVALPYLRRYRYPLRVER